MKAAILCLSTLSFGDASGYDIKKIIEERFGRFIDASTSGVYAVLRELLADGYVEYSAIEQSHAPNKKVYRITQSGHDYLVAELATLEPEHKLRSQFGLLLIFAEFLPKNRLSEVLALREQAIIRDMELSNLRLQQLNEFVTEPDGKTFFIKLFLEQAAVELAYIRAHKDELISAVTQRHAQKKAGDITMAGFERGHEKFGKIE